MAKGTNMSNYGQILRIVAVMGITGATAACSGDTDSMMEHMTEGSAATMSHGPGTPGMEGMEMDSLVMRQHALEADSIVRDMRQHVQTLRQMPAAEWHAAMATHVPRVAGMLSMMDRHMREMDMGMGMGHEHMGDMMGMSAAEHGSMIDDMSALRSDAERLQTASAAEVMSSTPAHLDRLERMLDAMERSAAHMRNAGTMH
jgi:hypothetical protein